MNKEVYCQDCKYYEEFSSTFGKKVIGTYKTPIRKGDERCEYNKENKDNNCKHYEEKPKEVEVKKKDFWGRFLR